VGRNDGNLDFAIGSLDGFALSVVLGHGNGTFQPGLGYTGSAGFNFTADCALLDSRLSWVPLGISS
jgi:hypothetical protein